MDRLNQLFEQFLRERTYVNNVTASTREWYETAWKAFRAAHTSAPERPASAPLIAKADLQQFVVHLRERGLKPVTCNTWIRALNAFDGCTSRTNSGDVVRLSIILGHTEVSTTMKYLHLLTEDLQRPHQSLSILNRLR